MSLSAFLLRVARQGWRPLAGYSVGVGLAVNLVALPLYKGTPVDLTAFATLIAACAPLFAVRAWEKRHEEPS